MPVLTVPACLWLQEFHTEQESCSPTRITLNIYTHHHLCEGWGMHSDFSVLWAKAKCCRKTRSGCSACLLPAHTASEPRLQAAHTTGHQSLPSLPAPVCLCNAPWLWARWGCCRGNPTLLWRLTPAPGCFTPSAHLGGWPRFSMPLSEATEEAAGDLDGVWCTSASQTLSN